MPYIAAPTDFWKGLLFSLNSVASSTMLSTMQSTMQHNAVLLQQMLSTSVDSIVCLFGGFINLYSNGCIWQNFGRLWSARFYSMEVNLHHHSLNLNFCKWFFFASKSVFEEDNTFLLHLFIFPDTAKYSVQRDSIFNKMGPKKKTTKKKWMSEKFQFKWKKFSSQTSK